MFCFGGRNGAAALPENFVMTKSAFAALLIAVLGLLLTWSWINPAVAQVERGHPGISVYKSAGCIICHKWHGMGGPGYGGTPINFRETILDTKQLIEVIACGRPGTGMPFFRKDAYGKYDCYEGMTSDDLGSDFPGKSSKQLSPRQIKNVALFILEQYKGRPDVVEEDCRIFFGESRTCRNIDAMMDSGGGGGKH